MPTLTTTIEDTSPVIVYSGNEGEDWSAGTSNVDRFVDQYSQSSYTVTSVNNANVSFSFNGVGVQIYGAKRSGHGPYQIIIDSFLYPQENGDISGDAEFQTSLFTATALTNSYHTVTMTNLGTASLDIDFITWQTPVGATDESLLAWTDEDTTPSFTYLPESAWNANPSNLGMFSGGSGHSTTTAGASVEYSFETGDAVAIFGPVGPNGAPYSAQLNDGPPSNFSTLKQFYRPQMVLFQAGNLGSGTHTVKLVSQAWNNATLSLAIDYAQVFTTQSLQSKDSGGLSAGAIIGLSIGGITCLLALIISFIAFRRLKPLAYHKLFRSRKKSRSAVYSNSDGAFNYRSISFVDQTPNPPLTSSSHQRLMSTSISHETPPTTAWPSSGGSYAPSPMDTAAVDQFGPNIQTLTIPYTSDGKYRPDLPAAAPLLPPPQGGRRVSPSPAPVARTQAQPIHRDTQSSVATYASTRQPSADSFDQENVQRVVSTGPDDRGPAQPSVVIAPVRRAPSVPVSVSAFSFSLSDEVTSPPPQYKRHPSTRWS